jgi:hypothetical protein
MTVTEYLKSLSKENREVVSALRKIIVESDKSVKEKVGKAMGGGDSLVYFEDNVFKYCIAITKKYFSFHSLIMYSTPALYKLAQECFPDAKFQKGCINFKSLEEIPSSAFKKFMKESAKADFSPVINHYKKVKKIK